MTVATTYYSKPIQTSFHIPSIHRKKKHFQRYSFDARNQLSETCHFLHVVSERSSFCWLRVGSICYHRIVHIAPIRVLKSSCHASCNWIGFSFLYTVTMVVYRSRRDNGSKGCYSQKYHAILLIMSCGGNHFCHLGHFLE